MKSKHDTLHALACLGLILTAGARPTAAQPYELRWSESISSAADWFNCRSWNNAAPDQYTRVSVVDSIFIKDNGSFKAKAASLTIDTGAGGILEIQPGAELEISAEKSTPAGTRRFDEMTWLTSHNAFTNYEENVIYAQQTSSVTSQLEDGVRGLMLDVHDWEGVGDQDIYLCHGDGFCAVPFLNPNNLGTGSADAAIASIIVCLASVVCGPAGAALILAAYVTADTSERRKLEDTLAEVKTFLDENPDEIVTIILEHYADVSDVNNRLISAGLGGYMYDPEQDSPDGTVGCWPSLDYLRSANRRLIVTVQSATRDQEGRILGQFAYMVENTYDIGIGISNYDPTCESRNATALTDRNRKLFVMNHFAKITLPNEFLFDSDFTSPLDEVSFGGEDSPNDFDRLLSRVDDECTIAAERYPNFVAVDFYEYPTDDGPAEVVAALNARWTPTAFGYNVPPPAAAPSPIAGAFLSEASQETSSTAGKTGGTPPDEYRLGANYPNPFSGRTTVPFGVPEQANVRITVYDLLGQVVYVTEQSTQPAGAHQVVLDLSTLAPGAYFYRLEAGGYSAVRKMIKIGNQNR